MKKIETINNKVKKQQTHDLLVITLNHEMWKAKKAKTHNKNREKGLKQKSRRKGHLTWTETRKECDLAKSTGKGREKSYLARFKPCQKKAREEKSRLSMFDINRPKPILLVEAAMWTRKEFWSRVYQIQACKLHKWG